MTIWGKILYCIGFPDADDDLVPTDALSITKKIRNRVEMSSPEIKVEAQPPLSLPTTTWAIDTKPFLQLDSPSPSPIKAEIEPVPLLSLTSTKPSMDDPELPKPKTGRRKTNPPPVVPVLISHLPTAWEEAHEGFDELEKCVYERKDLGLSREQDEMMVCDCVFDRRERAWASPPLTLQKRKMKVSRS